MLNETASEAFELTFESAIQVTQDPLMITYILIWFLIPLFLYLIIGATVRGRSADGRKTSKPMIVNPNYWYAFLILFLVEAVFFLGLIFPIWLRFFT